jgi:hypothetical protein
MSLYHYTCAHSLAKMRPDPYGYVTLQPLSPGGLLWLTDLETPIREALGLTSQIINCDRTEYRLELLDHSTVRRWVDVRRMYRGLWDLEFAPGAMPMHWFVSTSPERAKLAPVKADRQDRNAPGNLAASLVSE